MGGSGVSPDGTGDNCGENITIMYFHVNLYFINVKNVTISLRLLLSAGFLKLNNINALNKIISRSAQMAQ
jgi:hypothetical protein